MDIQTTDKKSPQILIVDDVDTNLYILEEIIKSMGYVSKCASSVKEAAQLIEEELPQLILLDVFMPEITGFEFCEKLKENVKTRDIPIIFISAATAQEDKWRGFELGAVDFINKPFDVREVTMRVNNHLKMYQMKQELENTNRHLHMVIDSQMKRIEEEQRNTLYALATISEEGKASGAHLDNVGHNSRILAQSLQLSPDFNEDISENFIETIGLASVLHDIGKIRTNEGTKINPLGEDAEDVGVHAEQGAHLLEQIYNLTYKNEYLAMAIDIARYHHTRWDGMGSADGKSGKEIPLSARIVAVVDIFEIITTEYKNHITDIKCCDIIQKRAGTYYDPGIVNIFMKIRKQMRKS